MPGFERNRFTDLSEREAKHLKCSICLNIYENAVKSECEHTFCKNCVQNWIETNHKECPECRTVFPFRKRSVFTRSTDKLVLIRNYIFKPNFLANSLVNDLTIKCDFDFNGCQQTLKLDSLSPHVKECRHRFCAKCDFILDKLNEHNCIELLKNDRNEWKDKCKELSKYKSIMESVLSYRLKPILEALSEISDQNIINQLMSIESKDTADSQSLETQLLIASLLTIDQQMSPSIDYIVFGTYKTTIKSFRLSAESIQLCKIESNDINKIKYNVLVPFIEIQQIMYCKHPSLRLIIIKPNPSSCGKIQETLRLGDNSPNDYKFDVNSNDSKHKNIIIVFKEDFQLFGICVRFLELLKTKVKIQAINEESAKRLVETTINSSH